MSDKKTTTQLALDVMAERGTIDQKYLEILTIHGKLLDKIALCITSFENRLKALEHEA